MGETAEDVLKASAVMWGVMRELNVRDPHPKECQVCHFTALVAKPSDLAYCAYCGNGPF